MKLNIRLLSVGALAFTACSLLMIPYSLAQQAGPAAPELDAATLAHLVGVSVGTVLIILSLASSAASFVCAMTPTPNPTTPWGRVYQVIEWLAIITRNTKETGYPAVDALHTAALALAAHPVPVQGPAAAKVLAADSGPTVAKVGTALLVAFGLAASLSACASSDRPGTLAEYLASPAGKALLVSLSKSSSSVARIADRVDSDLAATAEDKEIVCSGVSAADLAFKTFLVFNPGVLPAEAQANEQKAYDAAQLVCAGDTGDLIGVVQTAAREFVAIKGYVDKAATNPTTYGYLHRPWQPAGFDPPGLFWGRSPARWPEGT
jgi:hypothetical protein